MQFTQDNTLEIDEASLTTKDRRMLRIGRRAKERMMKANLRLVVSVAKNTKAGAGTSRSDSGRVLGLERAVEKFDPTADTSSPLMPSGGFARA